MTASPTLKDWGIEISKLTDASGVVVTKVDLGTDVYKLGIRPGDVITFINTKRIYAPDDVTKILQALQAAGKKQFSVSVNGSSIKFTF